MNKSIIKAVFKSTQLRKTTFLYMVFLALCISISKILYVWFIKKLIDDVVWGDASMMTADGFLLAVFAVVSMLIKRQLSVYSEELGLRLEKEMKTRYFDKLNVINLAELHRYASADILNRFNNEIAQIIQFNVKSLIQFVSDVFLMLAIFVYVGLNNYVLLLFVIIIVPVFFITKYFGVKSGDEYLKHQKAQTDLQILAKDIIGFSDDVRAYTADSFFREKYRTCENHLNAHARRLAVLNRYFWTTNIAGYQLTYTLFYVVGGFLAYYQKADFSVVISLFVLLDPLVDMTQSIAQIYENLFTTKVSLERYNEIMEIDEIDHLPLIPLPDQVHCSVSDLSYSYSNTYQDVPRKAITDIHLDFSTRQKIAIIGKSGCGKSTLLRLLMGSDVHYTGSITMNGIEIRTIHPQSLKGIFSYLPQEVRLLNDTIDRNLDIMMSGQVDTDKKHRFAAMVELEEDIEGMPNGYQTQMENGGENVSFGQRQRIGILMALMKESPMLIFDESFSAMDPIMTVKIIQNINQRVKCGYIIVTHAVYDGIMEGFDHIIVMEDGKVVAHDRFENIKLNPHYLRLEKAVVRG